jgi:light-regulated signal transduction histidine kinase (bacteriophytochrome)
VIELLGPSIKETATKIDIERLPHIYGDPVQIRQVFQNLISNAIKFRSEKPISIQIRAHLENAEWVIQVSDNGIGISSEFSDKIFQIFQRLHTREKYPGSGIGLAICKKIIERHKGRIWVHSTLEMGSTFSFSIPSSDMPYNLRATSPIGGKRFPTISP